MTQNGRPVHVLPPVINDRQFLQDVLPNFRYDEYDIVGDVANIRWLTGCFAFQLSINWSVGQTHVAIKIGGLGNLDNSRWKIESQNNGATIAVSRSQLAFDDQVVFKPRSNCFGCDGPRIQDVRVSSGFYHHAWSTLQQSIHDVARRLRDVCSPGVDSWKTFESMPTFPNVPWVDLNFTDMKTMMNGLIKRNVV